MRDQSVAANVLNNCYSIEDQQDTLVRDRINITTGRSQHSEIQQFYTGQSVFITGGTGFLGKALIEKLLRSCPSLDTIYVLVRNKKGQDPHTRINEMLDNALFKRALEMNPKAVHKVVPISGDFQLAGLGLSPGDRKLITDKVSIIINAAATVRFDEHIALATSINVSGTREVIQLARNCRSLAAICHVSTAYAHCYRRDVDEVFYEPPMSAEAISTLATIDKDILEQITPKLIGEFPNTYCFTKAISESAVRQYGEGIPICIVRPGIVVPTYEEPIRGWTDNMYGPTGIMVGIGTGVLRTMLMDPKLKADLVPVDLTVNNILAATWYTAKRYKENETSDIPIYNYVSSTQNPIKWGEFIEMNRANGIDKPTMKAIWYYGLNITTNYYLFRFYNFFLHFLPALLIDCFLLVTGKPTMMMSLYKKVYKFSTILRYFATREWNFTNNNVQTLWTKLSKTDQTLFPFNIGDMSWEYHSETFLVGLRVYLVKDDLSTLPEAKKKWQRLYIQHQILKAFVYFIAFNIIYFILSKLYNVFN